MKLKLQRLKKPKMRKDRHKKPTTAKMMVIMILSTRRVGCATVRTNLRMAVRAVRQISVSTRVRIAGPAVIQIATLTFARCA